MAAPRISLFVLDTGPLITLAAAESLDYLLYPNVPVVIPDAVFYEATRDIARLGAQSILDWVKAHHTQVEIAVTNAYINFDAARSINLQTYQGIGTWIWLDSLVEGLARLGGHGFYGNPHRTAGRTPWSSLSRAWKA
jgi:hypothetical protein